MPMPLMLTCFLAIAAMPLNHSLSDDLLTVAEQSDYNETATYAQVLELLDRIQARSDFMRRTSLGTSVEGRDIPLVILANPPVTTAAEARASGKPVAFIMGNIHAGEVCGKEALLMLTREIALNPEHPLLDNLVLVFAPIYNADGNERFAPNDVNRPGQIGPRTMGQRPNAQGLDLNRDYIKLTAPETRALVAFYNEWDPLISMDLHTTNGSFHRYTLTFDYPLNPSGHPGPRRYVRDTLLPAVQQRLRERTGYETFYYGNFNRQRTTWTTYSSLPRFGGPYFALRNHMAILSEAYAYAPFRDRVLCTLEFVRDVLEHTTEHAEAMQAIHDQARAETIAAGRHPQPTDMVGLRHRPAAMPGLAMIKGYLEYRDEHGRHLDLEQPHEYPVVHLGRFEPTLSVVRPYAYIIEPGFDAIIEKLQQHGIIVEPFHGPALVEQYTITDIERAGRAFQGHRNVSVEAAAELKRWDAPAGSSIIYTAQPLGTLAVFLLEPQSSDGLVTWNFLDDHIAVGSAYPIRRIRAQLDLNRAE